MNRRIVPGCIRVNKIAGVVHKHIHKHARFTNIRHSICLANIRHKVAEHRVDTNRRRRSLSGRGRQRPLDPICPTKTNQTGASSPVLSKWAAIVSELGFEYRLGRCAPVNDRQSNVRPIHLGLISVCVGESHCGRLLEGLAVPGWWVGG